MGKSNTNNKSDRTSSYTEFFYYFFRNILLVSIPLLIISALVLSSLHISADIPNNGSGSSTDTLSFSISSSCTLSSVVDENHNAELINGTYVNGIGQTTITTLCNDGNGYSIYADGYSNNEEGNNKLVNTENSNFNIISGTAQSGTTSNWAMSLNNLVDDPSLTPPTIENAYNNTYGIVPNEWTKVASLPARATDMVKGSSFTTTYAVYTSSSQYAGTYNGQVKYMLVHPSYKPAVYFMQDVASWKEFLNLEESVQAIDQRDGKSYWVTKLKDGNVWMTQNLDFDIDATRTYTHNDTDLGWDTTSFDVNATWTPVNGTSASGWATSTNSPYSADPGDVYYYTSNSSNNDIKYTSLSDCTTAGHTEDECKHYHIGNYYNWTAAIASNNSSSLATQYANAPNSVCPKGWRLPIATNADQSTYEFGELLYEQSITASKTSTTYVTDGFNNIRRGPLWFTRGGSIDTFLGNLSYGYYYSGTIASNGAYFLKFGVSSIQTSQSVDGIFGKSNGMSLRCLARSAG